MATNRTVFDHAVQTADEWLASVARSSSTHDQAFANRALRAWLHGLRDELTVEVCAHFAAQLPEVLRASTTRGGTPPGPVDHDLDAYVRRFAREAQVRPTEVRHVASTVTSALHQRLSAGQITTVLEQLPPRLRELLWVAPRNAAQPRGEQAPAQAEHRLTQLEHEVRTLTSAVNELVHGLEHRPVAEPTDDRATKAAHRAHCQRRGCA